LQRPGEAGSAQGLDPMTRALQRIQDQVRQAAAERTLLEIRGGGTKAFYGGEPIGELLDMRPLTGISSYEPSELVVTVRAGTPLAELEAALAQKGQCLPFEPPRFAPGGTVGGMVAAGLAGPARASVGGVRDYVLGATLLNGRGELLSFGGQVMKNVAGYDISRALAGSMGVLGVICEVSLKVLPLPPAVVTVRLEMNAATAIRRLNEWGGQPLPLNASAWWDGMLVLRLAGAAAAVKAAQEKMGGEVIAPASADPFWQGLRDHSDEFFVGAAKAVEGGASLWRLSVPATAPPLKLSGEQLLEWGGAQRWICTSAPGNTLRDAAAAVGGHAVLFRAREKSGGAFAPLKPPLDRIHRELKKAFDPAQIFNPGRLVPGL
jgi:glycolate oxidase FAD binding subunit